MTNYNEKYTQLTAELRKCIRLRKSCDTLRFAYNGVGYDVADRQDRILLIKRMSNDYMAEHAEYNQHNIDRWVNGGCRGERPKTVDANTALLESLTDAILDEELTDPNEHKLSQTEYPFMSATQLEARYEREVSLKVAEEAGTDGRNYRLPTRRKRTKSEQRYLDRDLRRRNAERSAQYKRDTSPGRIEPYNLRETGGELAPDFVECVGISDVWRKLIDQSESIEDSRY